MRLGELMRFSRENAGAGLVETARALDLSKGTLSGWEHGNGKPSLWVVDLYEEWFGGDGILHVAHADACTEPRARPPDASDAPSTPYPLEGDRSEFIADMSVPDGMVVPPGYAFEKVWRLRNAGSVPWVGRLLGRRGAAAGHGIPRSPARVRIPDTAPGCLVDIHVPIRAQPIPGTAEAHWKMVDSNGLEFFPDRYPLGIVLTITVIAGLPRPCSAGESDAGAASTVPAEDY